MVKKIKCEGLCDDCQTHYSDSRVTMAEIKKELTYIREALELNTKQHDEIMSTLKSFKTELDNKADKSEVKEINQKLWGFIIFVAGILLSVVGYLFVQWMANH